MDRKRLEHSLVFRLDTGRELVTVTIHKTRDVALSVPFDVVY